MSALDWRKRPRPGKGPVPRGGVTARRKAATARRVRLQAEGSPLEKIASHIRYAGSCDFLARFWARVVIGAPNECWPWTGQYNKRSGYGVAKYRRTSSPAHRAAYELSAGVDLPTEMFVCHSCDNPPCCNPAHHFEGTALDNNRDSISKGRHPPITHCRRGHPLEGDNVLVWKRPKGTTVKRCRYCTRRKAMQNYHKRHGDMAKAEAWAP